MNYDIRTTPGQIKAVAEWCENGKDMADVELAVDDRMLVAQQGDELMAWDLGGEPATEIYLSANPPLDPTGTDRMTRAHELLRQVKRLLDGERAQRYDDLVQLGAAITTYLETGR